MKGMITLNEVLTHETYSYEEGAIWRTIDKDVDGVFSSKLTHNQIVELLNNKTTNNEYISTTNSIIFIIIFQHSFTYVLS